MENNLEFRENKKKILFIIPYYKPDIRTIKFIKSFWERNFDIYILAYRMRDFNLYKDVLDLDRIENIKIYSIKSIFKTPNIPFNIFRDKKICDFINKIKPHYVFCRDIFLSTFLNSSFKKKNFSTRFILDICDNYPEVFEVIYRIKGKLFSFILNHIEKRALKIFDHINFVSDYSFKFICQKHGIDKLEYSIIYNVPLIMDNLECKFKMDREGIVYIGTIDRNIRDIDTVLKAIKFLKEAYNVSINFDIYYFKSDENLVNYYRNLCISYNIIDNVNFIIAVPHFQLCSILRKYKIGIIPHCRNKAVDFTIPNKIFDYIQNGLAILSSDNPALCELVEKYDLGLVYKGEDYIDCAIKMRKLLNIYNENDYNSKGINIIKKELNWDKIFEKFFVQLII